MYAMVRNTTYTLICKDNYDFCHLDGWILYVHWNVLKYLHKRVQVPFMPQILMYSHKCDGCFEYVQRTLLPNLLSILVSPSIVHRRDFDSKTLCYGMVRRSTLTRIRIKENSCHHPIPCHPYIRYSSYILSNNNSNNKICMYVYI